MMMHKYTVKFLFHLCSKNRQNPELFGIFCHNGKKPEILFEFLTVKGMTSNIVLRFKPKNAFP